MRSFASINNELTKKEIDKVNRVLKEYSIIPDNIEKKRSVYKIKCGSKLYCLKKIRHHYKKVVVGSSLVDYLKSKGFHNVANYIKTDNDKIYVKIKDNIYYLTEWINGKESDFNDFNEIKDATKLLAKFHTCSKGFSPQGVHLNSNIKNWPGNFSKQKNDLIIYKRIIDNKKIKSIFDNMYCESMDNFVNFMNKSIELINTSNYMYLCSVAKSEKTICHDSFYYQNILIYDKSMYVIDLDSTIYDINVYDLAKFIRRILYRSCYEWNFDIAKEIIKEYTDIKPLTKDEYKILLAFIIFPHKFWKLGKKKYAKNKRWNEDRYIKKLGKLLKYIQKQWLFIETFVDYYDISDVQQKSS